MWFDGDVKHHYFSNKANLNKWIKEFVTEVKDNSDYYDPYIKGKSFKVLVKYYSSTLFVEKVELDI